MKKIHIAIMTLLSSAMVAGCGGGDGIGFSTAPTVKQQRLATTSTAKSAEYNSAVQQLYIAYFGRPADTSGLANFSASLAQANAPTTIAGISAAYSTNSTIKALVDAFGNSEESNALYTGDNQSFVNAIYLNVFNRSADASGLSFWAGAIDSGGLTKGNAALSIMAGALSNTSAQGLIDAAIVNNKTAVATNFTTALSTAPVNGYSGNSAASTARTMLATVSNTTDTDAFQSTITSTVATLGGYSVPGAPTIGTATAGSGSVSISFTAPSSNGGVTITGYTASCRTGSTTFTGTSASSPITVSGLTNGTAYTCSVTATNAAGTSPSSGSVSVTPATTTASVLCPFSQSVANATLGLTNSVSMTCTSTMRMITGNGVPDHATGKFPNSNNPHSIKAVNVSYSTTLTPALTSSSSSVAHKIGYANNSVPFDPATAESYQNAGVWKIEALNQTYFPLGADSSNAHVQPDGTYHYHGMPEGYLTLLGKGTAMTLVGFALDGFPIYARYGYSTATDSTSGVRVINASYRLKTTPSNGRPSTNIVAMGTFTQDYEYVAGLGDLDECNGRFGVTPEFPGGIYHYYITDGYPYIQRCVKGTPMYNGTAAQ